MTVKQKLPNNPRRVPLTKADRAFVYQRDQGVCQHCYGAVNRYAFDIDHVRRVVGGGGNLPSNLLLCHQTCNRRRGRRTLAEWRAVLKAEVENQPHFPRKRSNPEISERDPVTAIAATTS